MASETPSPLLKTAVAMPVSPLPPAAPSDARRAHEVCAIEVLMDLTGWSRTKAREELKGVEWMYSKFGGFLHGAGKRKGDRGRVPEAWLVTDKCAAYIRKQFAEHARPTPKEATAAFKAAGPAAGKKSAPKPTRTAAVLESILLHAGAPSDAGAVRLFDRLAAKWFNTKNCCVKNVDADSGLHQWQPADHKLLEKIGAAAFDFGADSGARITF
jgi:hypothetical protein